MNKHTAKKAFTAPCEAKPYGSDKAFYEIRDANNDEIGGGWTKDEAAYIVKAVNAHEALVSALHECIITNSYWHGEGCAARDNVSKCNCWVSRAKAALKLAGEE